jgi:Zn finger protein HypA/HybF involved in hydrogenase expression
MADIFEKITDKIDRSVVSITKKGEVIKLKTEIKELHNLIENRFQVLGKKVFQMLNKGSLNEDELKADCKEIINLFKKISELENAIKQIEAEKGEIICPKCGSLNRVGSKFCMKCGSPTEEAKLDAKTCPACGASVKEGARFCMRCGAKIE